MATGYWAPEPGALLYAGGADKSDTGYASAATGATGMEISGSPLFMENGIGYAGGGCLLAPKSMPGMAVAVVVEVVENYNERSCVS